jgi:hypothetical protein
MSYNCQTVSTFDIDHIIPQSLFDSSSIPKSHLIKNALFNLCPLPSKSNAKKNDKKLNEITDNWLIGQIEIFSEIKRTNFAKFSDVQKWEDLRIMRSKIFEIKFIRERLRIVNN